MFKNKNVLSLNSLSIAESYRRYHSSLVENFVLKLPKPPNNFGIHSVNNYYKKFDLKER